MRLILVRHGQTDSNTRFLLDTGHPGAPLNEHGLSQAAALVQTLADEPIEAVYSSDLTRAMQTAAPLAEKLGLTAVALQGFREIFAGDDDMAADWSEYVAVLNQWGDDPHARRPGGESAVEFLARWDEALAHVEEQGHACAVVVSHGAALRVWVPFIASNLTAGAASQWPLHNTAIIVLDGSRADGWQVRSWTDVDLSEVDP